MSDYEPPMPIMKAVAASISQSTGQNVRKRAEQDGQVQEMHADMVKAVCGRRSDYPEDVFRAYLKRHILEAEARGAAEQRRKDAEAQEPVYQYQYSDQSWCDTSQAEYERNTALDPNDTRILYTHPANVAALEARIAELEGVISHLLETEEITDPSKPRILDLAYTAFMSGACGKNPDDGGKCDWFNDTRPKIMRHIENARSALTREGGV